MASTTTTTAAASTTTRTIDYDDILTESIDALIRIYLKRINRPPPVRCLYRWTIYNEPDVSYSVVVKIFRASTH